MSAKVDCWRAAMRAKREVFRAQDAAAKMDSEQGEKARELLLEVRHRLEALDRLLDVYE